MNFYLRVFMYTVLFCKLVSSLKYYVNIQILKIYYNTFIYNRFLKNNDTVGNSLLLQLLC